MHEEVEGPPDSNILAAQKHTRTLVQSVIESQHMVTDNARTINALLVAYALFVHDHDAAQITLDAIMMQHNSHSTRRWFFYYLIQLKYVLSDNPYES